MTVLVRAYDPTRDAAALRALVIELQDFEHVLEPRLPRGVDAVDAYLAQLFEHVKKQHGRLVVAEDEGSVVGFVGVMTRAAREDPTEPAGDFAYVSDLVVLKSHRGRGIGRILLDRATELAREAGVNVLELRVLSKNANALKLYEANGFTGFQVRMVKSLHARTSNR